MSESLKVQFGAGNSLMVEYLPNMLQVLESIPSIPSGV